MRALSFGLLVLIVCGCSDPKSETPAPEPTPQPEPKAEDGAKAAEPPAPKRKSDEELTKALVGRWDGLQVFRNSRGVVPLDGLVTLEASGTMKFDGQARGGGMSRQIIGFGTWKVKDGNLVCVVEASNASKDVPNGSARTVEVRDIDDKELLYVDPNDQRTHSAKRATGAAAPTPPPKKKF